MTIWRLPDSPTAAVLWGSSGGRPIIRTPCGWDDGSGVERTWPEVLQLHGPVTDVDPKAAHQPVLDAGTMCGLPGCGQPVRHSIHDADAAGWRDAAEVLGVDPDEYQGGSQ